MTSTPPDPSSLQARLRLLRETAAGPISAVFVGELADGQRVAVKLLRDMPDGGVDHLFDLRDRARKLGNLRHRHHACVQHVARVDTRFALLSPYVDGIDLLDWVDVLAETGRLLPRRVACEILRSVAVALEAGSSGMPGLASGPKQWHRDLKPSNVIITRDGELKVTDFATGYTSLAGRAAKAGALKKGLVRYLSPERRDGRRSQGEADVYALGILALELFRGKWLRRLHSQNPAHDRHLADVVARVEDLQMRSDNDDRALRNLVLRMVAFDPEARPAIAEIAAAFRGFSDRTAGPSLEAFAHAHAVPWLEEPPAEPDAALAGVQAFVIERGQPLPDNAGQSVAILTLPDRYDLQLQSYGTETGEFHVDGPRNEVTDPRLRSLGGTDPRVETTADPDEDFAEGPEEPDPEETEAAAVPAAAELWGAQEDLLVDAPRREAPASPTRRPLPRPAEPALTPTPEASRPAADPQVPVGAVPVTSDQVVVEEIVLDDDDLIRGSGVVLVDDDFDLTPDMPTDESPQPVPATAASPTAAQSAPPAQVQLVEEVELELELDDEEDGAGAADAPPVHPIDADPAVEVAPLNPDSDRPPGFPWLVAIVVGVIIVALLAAIGGLGITVMVLAL